MEVITGTAGGGNSQRGWSWPPNDPIAVEPGGTDLTCVVTVASGGNVEWAPMSSAGAVTGGWTTITPGQSITINGGQRRALRPLSGSAACLFTWSGTGLDALAAYKGSKGSTISWG